tara:strand:+ start:169 stop:474 length:306 start_codon:yes stop_codon:yes gene_type:complete
MAAKKKPQKSLDKWTKQKWTTASGKPSTQGPKATGEAYMPAAKAAALKSTPAGRNTIAAANRAKRKATAAGKQYASHGLHKKKTVAKKKKAAKKRPARKRR